MSADLEAEFWRAISAARSLKGPRRVQWGVATVEYYGARRELYEPGGRALAFIVPVVEDGELIDLAAIGHRSQHVGTRMGIGRGLGMDAIAEARWGTAGLLLHDRPLAWLQDPVGAACLFDVGTARVALHGVPSISCSSVTFARRVKALFPPSEYRGKTPGRDPALPSEAP